MKMSKFLTAKYYQENIERLEKKLAKYIKNLSKQEKVKKNNMVTNIRKVSQKMKNKNLLSIEQNITEWEKMSNYNNYNYKKHFFKTSFLTL